MLFKCIPENSFLKKNLYFYLLWNLGIIWRIILSHFLVAKMLQEIWLKVNQDKVRAFFFFHPYSLFWHRKGCFISLGLMFSAHSQWDGLKIHGTLAKFLKFQTRKVLCKRKRQRQGLYTKDNGYPDPAVTALLSCCQSSCVAVVFCF